nr:hypothetical protein Iba_chr07fCG10100 [Ipomoea batatas]
MNTLSNLLVSKEAMQEDLNSASKSLSATANLPRVSAAAFLAAQSSLLRNSTSVETKPFSTFVELRKQLPQLGRVRVRRGLNRGGEAKRGADLGVVVLLVENGVDEGLDDGGERRLRDLSEESVDERQVRKGANPSFCSPRAMASSSVVAAASVSRSDSRFRHVITRFLKSTLNCLDSAIFYVQRRQYACWFAYDTA